MSAALNQFSHFFQAEAQGEVFGLIVRVRRRGRADARSGELDAVGIEYPGPGEPSAGIARFARPIEVESPAFAHIPPNLRHGSIRKTTPPPSNLAVFRRPE